MLNERILDYLGEKTVKTLGFFQLTNSYLFILTRNVRTKTVRLCLRRLGRYIRCRASYRHSAFVSFKNVNIVEEYPFGELATFQSSKGRLFGIT